MTPQDRLTVGEIDHAEKVFLEGRQHTRTIIKEICAAARASLSSGWQPIETAPKDCHVIVAYRDDTERYHVGEAYQRLSDDDEWQWWWAGEGPGDYHADAIYPAPELWQPLPTPPTSEQEQEGE